MSSRSGAGDGSLSSRRFSKTGGGSVRRQSTTGRGRAQAALPSDTATTPWTPPGSQGEGDGAGSRPMSGASATASSPRRAQPPSEGFTSVTSVLLRGRRPSMSSGSRGPGGPTMGGNTGGGGSPGSPAGASLGSAPGESLGRGGGTVNEQATGPVGVGMVGGMGFGVWSYGMGNGAGGQMGANGGMGGVMGGIVRPQSGMNFMMAAVGTSMRPIGSLYTGRAAPAHGAHMMSQSPWMNQPGNELHVHSAAIVNADVYAAANQREALAQSRRKAVDVHVVKMGFGVATRREDKSAIKKAAADRAAHRGALAAAATAKSLGIGSLNLGAWAAVAASTSPSDTDSDGVAATSPASQASPTSAQVSPNAAQLTPNGVWLNELSHVPTNDAPMPSFGTSARMASSRWSATDANASLRAALHSAPSSQDHNHGRTRPSALSGDPGSPASHSSRTVKGLRRGSSYGPQQVGMLNFGGVEMHQRDTSTMGPSLSNRVAVIEMLLEPARLRASSMNGAFPDIVRQTAGPHSSGPESARGPHSRTSTTTGLNSWHAGSPGGTMTNGQLAAQAAQQWGSPTNQTLQGLPDDGPDNGTFAGSPRLTRGQIRFSTFATPQQQLLAMQQQQQPQQPAPSSPQPALSPFATLHGRFSGQAALRQSATGERTPSSPLLHQLLHPTASEPLNCRPQPRLSSSGSTGVPEARSAGTPTQPFHLRKTLAARALEAQRA